MKLRFIFEKETPGTVRFKEDVGDPTDALDHLAVGTLYVRKPALKALGYKQGDAIIVTISKEDE